MIWALTKDDVKRGGAEAGRYLNTIGKTDLGALSDEQWETFCILLVNEANRAAGERLVGALTVPFE